MRVFIAFHLSNEPRKEIEKLLKKLQKKHWKVKWERIEKVHLTLFFLGSIRKEKLDLLKKVCRQATKETEVFTVSFKGLGCFPDFDFPRIIWLGLKGDLKSLANLQKNFKRQLRDLGFKTEKRAFKSHLTLGRIKGARARERREIGRQIKGLRIIDFKTPWLVNKIVLYESRCLAEGSVYKKLAEFIF